MPEERPTRERIVQEWKSDVIRYGVSTLADKVVEATTGWTPGMLINRLLGLRK